MHRAMKQWDAQRYDAWYETMLGKTAHERERELVFSFAALGLRQGQRALDAGCGTGIYALALAQKGFSVTAIDSSSEMLGLAASKATAQHVNVEFVEASAQRLPFRDNEFDLVISIGVLCFVNATESPIALKEMRRVLKPGHRLVVGTLNSWSPWAFLRRLKGLFKDTVYSQAEFTSPPELKGSFLAAGFEDVEVKTCLYFLPINSALYLKTAPLTERIGTAMFPRLGAFSAATGVKT
ncbi:MAG: class I SAM-dependent methyltransferase [Deltaproteobacteria bacterium]|nr:class I SAM-dependent methyltransferase [Deltaproteobacteria bacterium]